MSSILGEIKIYAASANKDLAAAIAKLLNVKIGETELKNFPDGETYVRIKESIRNADVFIIQSTSTPVNEHLMELLIMIDAMKRTSAGRITAVIPYYGYCRQDRKDKTREPISAKLVANLLTTAGADRVLSMDLHSPQLQGFFDIPLDYLRGRDIFASYCLQRLRGDFSDVVVVSPDVGSVARSRTFAKVLEKYAEKIGKPVAVPLAIVDKRRISGTETEQEHFIGEVDGKIAVMLDDILSTGGTLCKAAARAKAEGAKAVFACVTHPVLVKDEHTDAVDIIENSVLEEIVCLDTISIPDWKPHEHITLDMESTATATCIPHLRETIGKETGPKIKVLSAAEIIAKAIKCIHSGESIAAWRYVELPK